jgi:hypothetical protein
MVEPVKVVKDVAPPVPQNQQNNQKTIAVSELQKHKLFIATPCYGGQLTEPYFKSILRLVFFCDRNSIPLHFATIANESLITRARNTLVAFFLNSDCSHLFFIDADIEFNVEDVIKLMVADKDVAVGAYPKKGINWDTVKKYVETTPNSSAADIGVAGSEYAINFNFTGNNFQVNVQDGLIDLKDAGTGFMMIKRSVIEKMCAAHPELQYNNDINVDKELDKFTYALFDTIIDGDARRYLSEDYTFCRRWQKMGGQIWLDPSIVLNHYGSYAYRGNPVTMFNR